ncbi:MAG: hypothetical protein MUC96_28105 [Myxococcaceae bacterium]|jgi:hypothetical protein|nr:hypothetical protein [Myxococcaceae bacterium]
MFVPVWALVLVALVLTWALFALNGKNLLPVPDQGSRLFATPSVEAQRAIVELLAQHGLTQRFRGDTEGVKRAILWDGFTIITAPSPAVREKLLGTAGGIGVVVKDPIVAAEAAATFLRARGFSATVVRDAEPEIPICHLVTDALLGVNLNFRKHAVRFPLPQRVTS